MPPRLVIVADAKMLPALSSGLRDGGRFEIAAVSLADPVAAQAAAEGADAVALFYGAPTAPLPVALQALAPKVRDRGARLIAVLQREQAAHRDECFRAGASDLLFMPMPREQFVARLAGSVGLSFAADDGALVPVSVATRSSSSRVERALVSPNGVQAPAQLPLKAGETVRLSFGSFQSWGLVARAGPPTQIRFAGLAPDEETKIREWVKSGGKLPQPVAGAARAMPPPPPPGALGAQPRAVPPPPPPGTASPQPRAVPPPPPVAVAPQARPAPPAPPPAQPAARAAPGASPPLPPPEARAAPVTGPPPGFADRKSTRGGQPPTPPAGAQPVPPPKGGARPAAGTNGVDGPLAELFEKGDGAPAKPAAPEPPPAPKGPPWPGPIALAACKTAAMQVLAEQDPPPDVPAPVVASARKIAALLSVGERASIQKSGGDSYYADALAARVALDVASAEGIRLGSAKPAPSVDAEALSALTKAADEAAARLQKEANAAIAKGEVESLQLVTAASASLSRDLLSLKETADRLRGLAGALRMGAGSLDPEVVLPGQQPRPRPPPGPQAPAPVKQELRDFRGLDDKPGRGRGVIAAVVVVAAIALGAHALWFGVPHHVVIAADAAGRGVQRIDISGTVALVTVTPEWVASNDVMLPRLLQLLRARKVTKAILTLPSGKAAGILDVASGRATGLPAPPPPPPQP